ncbi:unnamed protein product, partial [Chrysoparadoxa australica]
WQVSFLVDDLVGGLFKAPSAVTLFQLLTDRLRHEVGAEAAVLYLFDEDHTAGRLWSLAPNPGHHSSQMPAVTVEAP